MASCCSFSARLAAASLAAAGDWPGLAVYAAGDRHLPVGDVLCGLLRLRLHLVSLGSVGCDPQPATLALPSRLASANVTLLFTMAPLGVAAAAHSASHLLASYCNMK